MSHLFLCTLVLVCARDKSELLRLRVEMRREISTAKNGRAYRKVRLCPEGRANDDDGYDYSAAFADEGDQFADGVDRDLTLTVRTGEGFTAKWMKHEYRVKVRHNGTHRLEILAVAPVVDEPDAAANEPPRTERERAHGNPFEDFLKSTAGYAKEPNPWGEPANRVWEEIEAVLKRKRYTSMADVTRTRKAMALLLHDDTKPAGQEMDALARANAFLDTWETVFRAPLSA